MSAQREHSGGVDLGSVMQWLELIRDGELRSMARALGRRRCGLRSSTCRERPRTQMTGRNGRHRSQQCIFLAMHAKRYIHMIADV
jgi:hypothetical protein